MSNLNGDVLNSRNCLRAIRLNLDVGSFIAAKYAVRWLLVAINLSLRIAMSDNSQSSEIVMDDEIDLKELFAVLWDGKLIITTITGIAAIHLSNCSAVAAQYLHGKCAARSL